MKKSLYSLGIFVLTLVLAVTLSAQAMAQQIRQIRIEGAERIEPSTILSYMSVTAGDRFDQGLLDRSLKNLYATGLFADIGLYQSGNDLVVRVVENPIINEIAFEGNDELKDDQLLSEIQARPRMVFTRTKVQADVERLQDIYRYSGRFSATIDPKIIKLDQNRVNLVFEINEGPETTISSINFIGNKRYDDDKLREVVNSKEDRWYRFLSSNDKYDPDRLSFDRELLRRFYLDHGYADFVIESAVAELSPDRKHFFVTFTLDEGQRYAVNSVNIESRIPELDANQMKKEVLIKPGDWYSASKVEDTVVRLTEAAGNMQYAFIDVRPSVTRNREERTIDLNFVLSEGEKTFVERININGNVRTLDEVIRREMELVEGDPYNTARLRESEQRIRDLAFFETVDVQTLPGSTPDKTVIDVAVSEKSTGELSIGAGFSTSDGALADFRLREKNFLGKGQDLSFATTLSTVRTEFDISFTEPYFLRRDLSAGFDLFHVTRDLQDESSFDRRQTGGALRMGYPLSENWRQFLSYRWERNEIKNVEPTASTFIRQQEGERVTSSVSQRLMYDTTDSRLNPTEGFIGRLDTELAGLGGDAQYVQFRLGGTWYYPIRDRWILSLLGEGGYVFGWGGEEVKINERFFIGGSTLRGFADSGIGPRDVGTNDALGGNRFYRGSAELSMPSGLPEEMGVRSHVFADAGSLGQIDDNGAGLVDEESLRVSVGAGLSWRSPMGPIRVDFAAPVMKEDFDEEEVFRFSFGTRF